MNAPKVFEPPSRYGRARALSMGPADSQRCRARGGLGREEVSSPGWPRTRRHAEHGVALDSQRCRAAGSLGREEVPSTRWPLDSQRCRATGRLGCEEVPTRAKVGGVASHNWPTHLLSRDEDVATGPSWGSPLKVTAARPVGPAPTARRRPSSGGTRPFPCTGAARLPPAPRKASSGWNPRVASSWGPPTSGQGLAAEDRGHRARGPALAPSDVGFAFSAMLPRGECPFSAL